MAHESIALRGYYTGGLETRETIRNGFAFDLRHLDLRNRVVLSASLQLSRGVERRATSTVDLTDPSNQCAYGRFEGASRLGAIRVPLTADALVDLQHAGGGFFAVDAVFEDAGGEPQRLPVSDVQAEVVLLLAREVGAAAAA